MRRGRRRRRDGLRLVVHVSLEGLMTSPVVEIEVTCPDCGHSYQDWYRPSINLSLDSFVDDLSRLRD